MNALTSASAGNGSAAPSLYNTYRWYRSYMDKRMPVSEAREEFGRLVDAAHFQDDWTVLTKNGEPRAVIVSYEWYREAEGRRAALVAGAAGAEAGADLNVSTPRETPRLTGGSGT